MTFGRLISLHRAGDRATAPRPRPVGAPRPRGAGDRATALVALALAGSLWGLTVPLSKLGLEWLYRMIQEPQRMFQRYAVGNGRFIWLLIKELAGRRWNAAARA